MSAEDSSDKADKKNLHFLMSGLLTDYYPAVAD